MNLLYHTTTLWLIAQQEAAPAAPANSGDFWTQFLSNPMSFLLIAMILLWVMVILPQQRQAKEQQKKLTAALNALKKNDHVVTSAGIHGVIVNASADSPTVTIRIDDSNNTKLTINRDAIVRVVLEENKKD
jgi:preprotein translocase subunit YajC